MDFLVGGLAGVGAGFFSNPFDVVKTRMQLQGELRAKGQHAVYYKNIPHAMYTIVKHDGVSALQKGLVPALWFQLVVNGVRLGIYQQADNYGLLRDEKKNTKFINSLFFGSIAGMCGGLVGSPLQLIKTQLMSYSSRKIAVGTQHGHPGTLYALSKIYNKNGFFGLWRGAHGMMIRNSIGSASQIASYAVIDFSEMRYFPAVESIAAFRENHWIDFDEIRYDDSWLSGPTYRILFTAGKYLISELNVKTNEERTRAERGCKEWMDNNNLFQQSKYLSAFLASNVGAVVKTVTLTPMDVIMTRLYNQGVDANGRGVLYSGIMDCARKITKTEGLLAFYKGIGPSYFRQAPHTVLLLVFWDMLKDLQKTTTLKM